MPLADARRIARPFLDEVRAAVESFPPIRLVGILATDARPSETYSDYAARGCRKVGIEYALRRAEQPEDVSRAIYEANQDPSVHGVIVFYPIFGGARDRSLQNEVDPEKDVEGLHGSWTQRLYHDVRFVEGDKKAILPCTPLGIVKALERLEVTDAAAGPRQLARGLTVTIFNRSEVVGRPLAALLAHDGARVYSFDIDDVHLFEGTREEPIEVERARALAESHVVITGVPDRDFPLVRAEDLGPDVRAVINFSYVKNLADDVVERVPQVLRRVGPITVAMLLRNTLRLYRNFHRPPGPSDRYPAV